MNHKILLALCLTASLTETSSLLHRLAWKNPIQRRLMTEFAHFSSQAEKNKRLEKSMVDLVQAQKRVIAALKDGGNPVAQMPTKQKRIRKRIIYKFMTHDLHQKVAEESYKSAGAKYRNVMGDIAAHRNNDTFLLQALVNGMPLNDPNNCGGFDTPLHTYFARLKGYQEVEPGNLHELILGNLYATDINSKNSSGATILDLIVLNGDYDLIEPAIQAGAQSRTSFSTSTVGEYHLVDGSPFKTLKNQLHEAETLETSEKVPKIKKAIKKLQGLKWAELIVQYAEAAGANNEKLLDAITSALQEVKMLTTQPAALPDRP